MQTKRETKAETLRRQEVRRVKYAVGAPRLTRKAA